MQPDFFRFVAGQVVVDQRFRSAISRSSALRLAILRDIPGVRLSSMQTPSFMHFALSGRHGEPGTIPWPHAFAP